MKISKFNFQQGDVIGIAVERIPDGAKLIAKDVMVLAEGETTGHAHRIESPGGELYRLGEKLYMKLLAPPHLECALRHEEHGPIVHEPKIWEIDGVREYDWLQHLERKIID